MTKSLIRDYTLQGIADAIREKKGFIGYWVVNNMLHYEFNEDGTGRMIMPTLENYSTFTYTYTDTTIHLEFEHTEDIDYTYEFLENGDLQFTEELSGGDTRTFTLSHETYLPSEMDDEIDALPYFDTENDVFNLTVDATTNINEYSYVKEVTFRVNSVDKIKQILRFDFRLFGYIHIIGYIPDGSNFNFGICGFNILDLSKLNVGNVHSVGSQFLYLFKNGTKLILPEKPFTVQTITPGSSYSGTFSFYPSTSLKYIENLEPWMMSFKNQYNFRQAFYFMSSLTDELSFDFSQYDIGDNAFVFQQMFYYCQNIPKITFNGGNLKVLNTNNMFGSCFNLDKVLGFNSFDTSALTNMDGMFFGCNNATSLWLPTNLPECTSMNASYRDLRVFSDDFNFTVEKVTNISYCFADSIYIKNVEITFGQDSVVNLDSAFYSVNSKQDQGSSIIKLNNLTKISNMSSTFNRCVYVKQIIMPNADFETSSTSYSKCFNSCSHLEVLDIRSLDFSKMNTAPSVNEFGTIPNTCTIYVKDSANKALLLAANSSFGSNVIAVN